MSALSTAIEGTIWEDGGASLMARVLGHNAAAITQASVSSITYKVFDLSSGTPPDQVTSGTLTVSSVVFDTYQTDARWTKDSTGYNFRWDAPASAFPSWSVYQIEIKFTPSSGETFFLVFKITANAIYSS